MGEPLTALVKAHDPSAPPRRDRARVYVEFRDGVVGKIISDDCVEVHLLIDDTTPHVIHGMRVAPDKALFDVTPQMISCGEYDRLIRGA